MDILTLKKTGIRALFVGGYFGVSLKDTRFFSSTSLQAGKKTTYFKSNLNYQSLWIGLKIISKQVTGIQWQNFQWQPAGLSCCPNTPEASLQLFAGISYFHCRWQKNYWQIYISTEAITFNFFFNSLICQAYKSRRVGFAGPQKHLWSPRISTTPGDGKEMDGRAAGGCFFLFALKHYIQFFSKWHWGVPCSASLTVDSRPGKPAISRRPALIAFPVVHNSSRSVATNWL